MKKLRFIRINNLMKIMKPGSTKAGFEPSFAWQLNLHFLLL